MIPGEPDKKLNYPELKQRAIAEQERIVNEITTLIDNIDPVELIAQISTLSQFNSLENPGRNEDLRELPYLHFLIGLVLKNGNRNNIHPDQSQVHQIIQLLKSFFNSNLQEMLFEKAPDSITPSDSLIFIARNQKLLE